MQARSSPALAAFGNYAGRGQEWVNDPVRAFHSTRLPLFLLAAYGKNEKANLSQAERNAMKRIVPFIVATFAAPKQ